MFSCRAAHWRAPLLSLRVCPSPVSSSVPSPPSTPPSSPAHCCPPKLASLNFPCIPQSVCCGLSLRQPSFHRLPQPHQFDDILRVSCVGPSWFLIGLWRHTSLGLDLWACFLVYWVKKCKSADLFWYAIHRTRQVIGMVVVPHPALIIS